MKAATTTRHALGVALLSGLVMGCGGPRTHTVKGKVTFDDGKPVGGGTILFMLVADKDMRTAATSSRTAPSPWPQQPGWAPSRETTWR